MLVHRALHLLQRSRYERFIAIREALRNGHDADALLHAKTNPGDWQGTLFSVRPAWNR